MVADWALRYRTMADSRTSDESSVFGKLSALDQAVLWLGHVEQLSHREIAEILGQGEQSIR